MPLTTHIHINSERGLSSITTLIVGSKENVIIDPPMLIADAQSIVQWAKKTSSNPVKAVFVTHHHPDHFFSANPILEAFPEASFYAAPYVVDGIEREYDSKVKYWPSVFVGEVPEKPKIPTRFPFSFFNLDGDKKSPIALLGPLQGDSIDHCLFWLPVEKAIICGDTVYARSTHAWVEEIETAALLEAWIKTLDLLETLETTTLIPGHIERGWEIDPAADIAHMRKYLKLLGEKVTYAKKKPGVQELYDIFKNEFPQCTANLHFFLHHLSNQFGEGGEVWEENRFQDVASRTLDGLTAYTL